MISEFFNQIFSFTNFFDFVVIIITIYSTIQCYLKGFTLSLISSMKWILSLVSTIILLPKLQPTVRDYIESDFINNVGLGVTIFILTLFLLIVVGKALNKAVTWTGVGSIDKTFGFLFGFFKAYIMCVCLFSILNWFYPYKNWGISADKALSFNLIFKGSNILVEEFPSNEDLKDTKEKIEKI